MLRGTVAAALTPLQEDESIDAAAFGPYVDFLASHGVDGILALGTTGEGVLFGTAERRQVAELFLEAADGRLQVAVHCGAQTTADTAALAEHAAASGAAAVAVIAPPYFAFDADELLQHFRAAADACSPVPFYVYEFAARSGYAVPPTVLASLRDVAPNFVGLKVSDTPWTSFAAYLVEGLDVFVGPEALIPEGLAGGAVGAVSGLAASFPEIVVALAREPSAEGAERTGALRATLQALPFHAASKTAVGFRGVPVGPTVRRPLRGLTGDERVAVERLVAEFAADSQPA